MSETASSTNGIKVTVPLRFVNGHNFTIMKVTQEDIPIVTWPHDTPVNFTCHRDDGFGSQLMNYMSCLVFVWHHCLSSCVLFTF